ncbi:globin domain-containing protein [Shewanella sp. GXUN23E]|uniref:globin domain-containing protein n=1 Tax=Shewanella sp. GXUN23E TaxID=3422498 RepID=UPI003D7E9A5E
MFLTQHQIDLIQYSFCQIAPDASRVADLFYDTLFELAPNIRPLFKNSANMQGQKLMQMLSSIVAGLDDLEALAPVIQEMGRRHVSYGVKPEYFIPLNQALMFSLRQHLRSEFTPEVRDAWATLLQWVYGVMQNAMQPAR